MNAAQALADARGYALAGRVRFIPHAWDEMDNAHATEADVIEALINGTRCRRGAKPGRWVITGMGLDGIVLEPVVVFDDGVLVITVW